MHKTLQFDKECSKGSYHVDLRQVPCTKLQKSYTCSPKVVTETGAAHLTRRKETVEQSLAVLPAASATAAMLARVTWDIKSRLTYLDWSFAV